MYVGANWSGCRYFFSEIKGKVMAENKLENNIVVKIYENKVDPLVLPGTCYFPP